MGSQVGSQGSLARKSNSATHCGFAHSPRMEPTHLPRNQPSASSRNPRGFNFATANAEVHQTEFEIMRLGMGGLKNQAVHAAPGGLHA